MKSIEAYAMDGNKPLLSSKGWSIADDVQIAWSLNKLSQNGLSPKWHICINIDIDIEIYIYTDE
jgi:hypothetical protein